MIRAVDCSAITPKSDGVPCTPRRAATRRLRRRPVGPDRQGDLPLHPTGVSIRILSTNFGSIIPGYDGQTAPCLATIFPRSSSDVTMFSILRTATCTRSTRPKPAPGPWRRAFARGGAFGARGADPRRRATSDCHRQDRERDAPRCIARPVRKPNEPEMRYTMTKRFSNTHGRTQRQGRAPHPDDHQPRWA